MESAVLDSGPHGSDNFSAVRDDYTGDRTRSQPYVRTSSSPSNNLDLPDLGPDGDIPDRARDTQTSRHSPEAQGYNVVEKAREPASPSSRARSTSEFHGGALSRSSTRRKAGRSQSSSHHFQLWGSFVSRNQKLLEARLKAEEKRNAFRELRENLRYITNEFLGIVAQLQADPSDKQAIKRVLGKSWRLKNAHELLGASEEALQAAESRLMQEEYSVRQAVPEVLRSDRDPEDTLSALERRGIDFRGDDSSPVEVSAERSVSNHNEYLDLDTESLPIIAEIDALEQRILELSDKREKLVKKALISDEGSSQDLSPTADDFNELDEQEKLLKGQLRDTLDELERLRDDGPDFAAEETDSAPRKDQVLILSQSRGSSNAINSQEELHRTTYESLRSMEELGALLHSITAEQIPVFPEQAIGESFDGRADPVDMINSWLFHQLRTSAHEMSKYVQRLEQISASLQDLTASQILDRVLRAWYNDSTYKVSQPQVEVNSTKNRSTRTNLGGSQVPFSTSTTVKNPSLREILTHNLRTQRTATKLSRSITGDN